MDLNLGAVQLCRARMNASVSSLNKLTNDFNVGITATEDRTSGAMSAPRTLTGLVLT